MSARRGEAVRCAAVALGFAGALLWPALWNGHALVYYDSASYALDARTLRFFEARAMGYPLFLLPSIAAGTSWIGVLAQSFATSLLALRVGMALAPSAQRPLLAAAAALAAALVLSPVAAHSSALMPDVFTGWLLLGGALALLATSRGDLWLGLAAWFAALWVHHTHLPIALALLLLAGVAATRGPLAERAFRRRLAGLALVVPVALTMQTAVARASGYRGPFGGHPAFLVARHHSMGVLVDVLDRRCGERAWRLCEHRDTLERHPTDNPAWFLWRPESPFERIGRFSARKELGEIARATLRDAWPRVAGATSRDAFEQFFLVETPSEFDLESASYYVDRLRDRLADEASRAAAGRQASGLTVHAAPFAPFERELHMALLAASLLVAWLCLRRGRRTLALWIAATWIFLAIHALVVGFGAMPMGRFQGRVAWLLPFALALGLAGLMKDPRASTHLRARS